jgi:phospholipid/cholesterol/gamma-HCH transport system substrate-binding protein
MRRLVPLVPALFLAVPILAGCGSTGLYGLPLPGGADLGDHPYRVTAQFADVLDLVPQATVKLNDVAVGKVDEITLAPDGALARAELRINGDVALPPNTGAELRSASLLGEKFVELTVPPGAPAPGRLADGAVIGLPGTKRYPEVEEVFGALSLLLNGGGIGQLNDIVREVNAATAGKAPQIRDLIDQLNVTTGRLNAQRADIVRAIDALGRLSTAFAGQTDRIDTALDQLEPGLAVLAEQRDQLVTALRALDDLSRVGVDTVHRGRDDIVADLKALRPTLEKLNKAGKNIPDSLQFLLTYPFTDQGIRAFKGDYANVDVEVAITLPTLPDLPIALRSALPPLPGLPANPLQAGLEPLIRKPTVPAPRPDRGLRDLLVPPPGGSR